MKIVTEVKNRFFKLLFFEQGFLIYYWYHTYKTYGHLYNILFEGSVSQNFD